MPAVFEAIVPTEAVKPAPGSRTVNEKLVIDHEPIVFVLSRIEPEANPLPMELLVTL